MKPDVFISHSSKDSETALRLYGHFRDNGINAWISSRDIPPGEDYQSCIVRAIAECRIMLLIFSENSNRSPEVVKELNLANRKYLIPVRIEDVQSPAPAFMYQIANRQVFDISGPSADRLAQLTEFVKQQLERIGDADGVQSAAPQAAPAGTGATAPEAPRRVVLPKTPAPPRTAPLLWLGAGVVALGLLAGWHFLQRPSEGVAPPVAAAEPKASGTVPTVLTTGTGPISPEQLVRYASGIPKDQASAVLNAKLMQRIEGKLDGAQLAIVAALLPPSELPTFLTGLVASGKLAPIGVPALVPLLKLVGSADASRVVKPLLPVIEAAPGVEWIPALDTTKTTNDRVVLWMVLQKAEKLQAFASQGDVETFCANFSQKKRGFGDGCASVAESRRETCLGVQEQEAACLDEVKGSKLAP